MKSTSMQQSFARSISDCEQIWCAGASESQRVTLTLTLSSE